MEENRVRVIAFKEGDMWVGQCLEYDIGAQAPDLDVLHNRLMMALGAERDESVRRHGTAFAGIEPAPPHFHEMWEKQSGGFSPRRSSTLPNDGHLNVEMALCA
jgi:hypothetical protein